MAAFAIDEFPVGDPNHSGWDVVFYNYGTCDSPGCHDEVTDGDRTHVIQTHDDGGAAMHYITRLYSNDSPGTFNAARRNSLSGPSHLAPANVIATHQATDQNNTSRSTPARAGCGAPV